MRYRRAVEFTNVVYAFAFLAGVGLTGHILAEEKQPYYTSKVPQSAFADTLPEQATPHPPCH